MSRKKVALYFKSYHWNALYEDVKGVEYDESIPIGSQYQLACKAMLLVAWWSDNVYSRKILSLYPVVIKDPLVHFLISYAFLCLGDVSKFNSYMKKKPKSYPKWMENYLNLEYFGRSQNYKSQILLARKLVPKEQYPPDYIKVAILQSLDHEGADISFLKKWLDDIYLFSDEDPYSIALCLKVNKMDLNDIDDSISPLLLSKKASHQLTNGQMVDSLQSFDALAKSKFLDINIINTWLTLSISIPQGREHLSKRANFAMSLVPNSLFVQGTAVTFLLIMSWINGEYKSSYNIVKMFNKYRELEETKFTKIPQIFFGYILYLCSFWQYNKHIFNQNTRNSLLYQIIGESHSLSLANIHFKIENRLYLAKTNFILGIKMHHLASPLMNGYKGAMKENIGAMKNNSNFFFTIGEIDTRPNEGIWQLHKKKKEDINAIIKNTVDGYIEFLYINLKEKNPNSVIVQGISAPGYSLEERNDVEDEAGFLLMIKNVNQRLKELTLLKGWGFLDVYSATVANDGKSNKKWHLDAYHLSPLFYTQMDEWLIK